MRKSNALERFPLLLLLFLLWSHSSRGTFTFHFVSFFPFASVFSISSFLLNQQANINHLNRIEGKKSAAICVWRCIDENPCTHAQARFAAAIMKNRNFDRIARLFFKPCHSLPSTLRLIIAFWFANSHAICENHPKKSKFLANNLLLFQTFSPIGFN